MIILGSAGLTKAAAGAGDPLFSSVRLLLPFDTDYTDESNANHTMSHSSTTTLNSTTKKWGAQAVDFVITTSTTVVGMTMPSAGTADDLTGDFTVEFWYYPRTIVPDLQRILTIGSLVLLQSLSKLYLDDSGFTDCETAAMTANNWYHVAWTRASGTNRLFLGGTVSASTLSASASLTGDYKFSGKIDGGNCIDKTNAILDDIRVTKGTARYTTSFTPPTAAFPTQ